MILYDVRYKKRLFWHRIKKVKGDGLLENGQARFFIKENEERIEVPCQNTIFKFSKERFFAIKERMEVEANQEIKINRR